jgi:hypothetical protein
LPGDPAPADACALVVVMPAGAVLRDCASVGSRVAAARSVALMAAVAINDFLSMV